MRIPSLADRPRFFEAGKIKIGKKAATARKSAAGREWYPPEKLDHFLITKNTRTDGVNLDIDTEAMEPYGGEKGKPTKLNIMFMFNPTITRSYSKMNVDISANFVSFLSYYAGRLCACRMNEDGATATRFRNGKTKLDPPQTVDCNPSDCPQHPENRGVTGKPGLCKPTGILRCMLQNSPTVGGVYVFRTHSWNTVQNIDSSLRQIMAVTGGILSCVPLQLTLSPKQTQTAEDKPVVIYEANINYPDSPEHLLETVKDITDTRQRLGVDPKVIERECSGYLLELLEETPGEQAQINEEFSPETVDAPAQFNGKAPSPEPPPAEQGDLPPTQIIPEQIVNDYVAQHNVTPQELEALKMAFTAAGGAPDWSSILDKLRLKYEGTHENSRPEKDDPQVSPKSSGALPGMS